MPQNEIFINSGIIKILILHFTVVILHVQASVTMLEHPTVIEPRISWLREEPRSP